MLPGNNAFDIFHFHVTTLSILPYSRLCAWVSKQHNLTLFRQLADLTMFAAEVQAIHKRPISANLINTTLTTVLYCGTLTRVNRQRIIKHLQNTSFCLTVCITFYQQGSAQLYDMPFGLGWHVAAWRRSSVFKSAIA